MSEHMTTAWLLDRLRAERQAWDGLLQRLEPAQMCQPGVAGDWSVKDVIAHVTWTERETVGMLHARAFVGSEWWLLPLDERNAKIYAANRERPLDEVQDEAAAVFAELLAAIAPLTDADLNNPQLFAHMPFALPAWEVLARNTYLHYRAHMPDLQAWAAQFAPGLVQE